MLNSLISFVIVFLIYETREYNIRLPVREETLCSGHPKCIKGSHNVTHSYCLKTITKQEQAKLSICKVLPLSENEENRLLLAVNGLRNKFAQDLKIGNMNYVYFEPILAKMGANYLSKCTNDFDICDYIGDKKDKLSQIKMMVNRTRSSITSKRPLGRVLRMWFNEAKNLDDFDSYRNSPEEKISALIVLMYPSANYFGCATSDFNDGSGYNMMCYFYPMIPSDHFTNYSIEPDTKKCSIKTCSFERHICSNTFNKLCGYDDPNRLARASITKEAIHLLVIMTIFMIFH